ncbi:hypothetical protein GCM10009733_011580 [Nonomuraea maheshkhaliensis]|uniref:Amidohydrolase-related domain-containing protein n=1 Tax=Nonomuraea maheshkhaliensis TaxID=419590 RepID=A0ABN2ET50_9ACTN
MYQPYVGPELGLTFEPIWGDDTTRETLTENALEFARVRGALRPAQSRARREALRPTGPLVSMNTPASPN